MPSKNENCHKVKLKKLSIQVSNSLYLMFKYLISASNSEECKNDCFLLLLIGVQQMK